MSDASISAGWVLKIDGLQRGTLLCTLSNDDRDAIPPPVQLCIDGETISEAEVTPHSDKFTLSAELPAAAINEGVTTVVFRAGTTILGAYPIKAGAALDADVVGDLAMLRAEFEALKAAFMADVHDPKLRVVERDVIIAEAVEAIVSAQATRSVPD